MLQHELKTAIALARLAGITILQHYADGFEIEEKMGVDNFSEPVTVADREASRIIVDGLLKVFPDDGILSEEEIDNLDHRLSKQRVWIIDPIDGTAGFVKHDGDFGVQIGLVEDGKPVVGIVYLPVHDVLSFAVRGEGSFTVTSGGPPVRMQTSAKRDFRNMSLAASRHHHSRRMSRIIDHFGFARIASRGSVGLKVGLIADKTCDLYISPGARTKLWDTCAPQVILEEAGGRLTDLFGVDLIYNTANLQNRNGILATNGTAHSLAVDHLSPLLQKFDRVPYAS